VLTEYEPEDGVLPFQKASLLRLQPIGRAPTDAMKADHVRYLTCDRLTCNLPGPDEVPMADMLLITAVPRAPPHHAALLVGGAADQPGQARRSGRLSLRQGRCLAVILSMH
jgi:hypothetical protein